MKLFFKEKLETSLIFFNNFATTIGSLSLMKFKIVSFKKYPSTADFGIPLDTSKRKVYFNRCLNATFRVGLLVRYPFKPAPRNECPEVQLRLLVFKR